VCVEVGWVRCLMCATSALITNRPMAATAYNEQRFDEPLFTEFYDGVTAMLRLVTALKNEK